MHTNYILYFNTIIFVMFFSLYGGLVGGEKYYKPYAYNLIIFAMTITIL